MKPQKLLVLAGGFGTRLRTVVSDVPKPLAPVLGVPFLQHLILSWKSQGIKEIILLLHYQAEMIKDLVKSMRFSGLIDDLEIEIVVEDEPLGTGGSVLNAVDSLNIQESFLVVNADTWLGSGLEEMMSAGPYSIGAVEVSDVGRYGELYILKGYVDEFREKSASDGTGWINAGIYHLCPEIFDNFRVGSSFSLEATVFPDFLEHSKLNAVKLDIDFIDIGIPEDYLRFCRWAKAGAIDEI